MLWSVGELLPTHISLGGTLSQEGPGRVPSKAGQRMWSTQVASTTPGTVTA